MRKKVLFILTSFAFMILVVLSSLAGKPPSGQTLPWGVDRIDADLVWNQNITGSGIKIAIIDTGIDKDHPDLVGKTDGINFLKVDCPGNDCPGDNFYEDVGGHGTAIAGIITANNNSIGVVGVAPGVTLYSVRMREKSGTVYPDNYPNQGQEYNFTPLCNAMKWCIENNVQVINFSLGIWTVNSNGEREYPLHDKEFYVLIKEAYSKGIVIVAAAGNGIPATNSKGRSIGTYTSPDTTTDVVFTDFIYDFPPSYPEVIAVSATGMKTSGKPSERGDYFPGFSNYGPAVAVAAPGASINTTWIEDSYVSGGSGTSYAAPHVVGTVALILQNMGKTSPEHGLPDTIKGILKTNAEKLAINYPDGNPIYLVDAEKAVKAVSNPTASQAPPHWSTISSTDKLPITWGRIKAK